MIKRSLLILAASTALASPALAQTKALPPGEIRANGDITFGNALKLGKREGNKTTITPDTLQILGPGSTGDASSMSAAAPGAAAARTLADLVGFAAGNTATIATLRALPTLPLVPNLSISVGGYYAAGDGGGGAFTWSPTSMATDDGALVIRPTAVSGAGRWLRVISGAYSAKMFGARCDGVTDDTAAIRAAIAKIDGPAGGALEFGGTGLCIVNTANGGPLTISAAYTTTLRGLGDGGIKNVATNGSDTFYVGNNTVTYRPALVRFDSLRVWGNKQNGSGLKVQYATNVKVESSSFYQNGGIGVFGDNNYGIVIDKNTITDNGQAGIHLSNAGANSARITSNIITGHRDTINSAAISIGGGLNYNAYISGNDIELNSIGILAGDINGLQIVGNYYENNQTSLGHLEMQITGSVNAALISGNTFYGYSVIAAKGAVVNGNAFLAEGDTGDLPIVLDATGAEGFVANGNALLKGSRFEGAAAVQAPATTFSGDHIRISQAKTPTSSAAPCTAGQMAWNTNYVFVCVAANTWKRSQLQGDW